MGRDSLTPQEKAARATISKKLRELLEKSGYTKTQVVDKIDISRTNIYTYFSGDRLPSQENVIKLAKFFHVKPEEIDPRLSTQTATSLDQDKPYTYRGYQVPEKYLAMVKSLMEADIKEGKAEKNE